MLKRIDEEEKVKPLYSSTKKVEITGFTAILKIKKGKWVYVPKEQYLTR
jgi:hypothetical protein